MSENKIERLAEEELKEAAMAHEHSYFKWLDQGSHKNPSYHFIRGAEYALKTAAKKEDKGVQDEKRLFDMFFELFFDIDCGQDTSKDKARYDAAKKCVEITLGYASQKDKGVGMKWVSVKIALPYSEKDGNYLVTDGKHIMLAFFWTHTGKWQFVEKDDYWQQDKITHWAKLPNLPKDESQSPSSSPAEKCDDLESRSLVMDYGGNKDDSWRKEDKGVGMRWTDADMLNVIWLSREGNNGLLQADQVLDKYESQSPSSSPAEVNHEPVDWDAILNDLSNEMEKNGSRAFVNSYGDLKTLYLIQWFRNRPEFKQPK